MELKPVARIRIQLFLRDLPDFFLHLCGNHIDININIDL